MSEIIKKTIILSVIAVSLLLRCSVTPIQTAGGSSDTEISGIVVDMNGKAVPDANVWLNSLESDTNMPSFGQDPDSRQFNDSVSRETMTDADGKFTISNVKTGSYAIEVNSGDSIAVLIYCTVDSGKSPTTLPTDTLKPMVVISGTIVPGGPRNAPIFIEGIYRHIQIDSLGRFQIKVPYGTHKVRILSPGQNKRNSIDLPYLPPGAALDIGFIDPSSIPEPPPCTDSACDASAMRLMLNDIGLDSVAIESVATFTAGRITAINLRHRGLHTLSIEISRLTQLEVLDIGDNLLHAPFKIIAQCASLRVLRADSNELPFLPDDIGALQDLTELDLSNNEISSLPISIIALTPAKLKLDNNRLLDITGAAAQWADTYEPNWRATQRPGGNFPKDYGQYFH